jgi:hypothetical protein
MIQAANFDLVDEYAIFQGEDWFLDFTVVDENGDPEPLTGYDQTFATFRTERDLSAQQEAVGVVTITAPASGGVRLMIPYATGLAMNAASGAYTVEIAKSAVSQSRRRLLWGEYQLSKTTI